MSDSKGKKRSNKAKYMQPDAKRKRMALDTGMKGFLLTCNFQEKGCVREAYNIFNEYADKVYGPEKLPGDSSDDDEEDDIEKALQKEVDSIKQSNANKSERRFQVMESGANNCIFIKTSIEDPCALAHQIFEDSYNSEVQKSRYTLRMLPISTTCKAFVEDIKKTAEEILKPHFLTEFGQGKTFCIQFKVRNNGKIGRNDVIPMVADIVSDFNPMHKADLSHGELVIVIEIIRNICCMSVVKDYFKFRKYNLSEVSHAKRRLEDLEREKLSKANQKEIESENSGAKNVENENIEEKNIKTEKTGENVEEKGVQEKPGTNDTGETKEGDDNSTEDVKV
ncbi:unnamed protein product [Owenia fusiformis]|uniref:Uncharacterized protein n=1 Tax=Owenia fusiformis TaxID=6347 RepID=A0A8J1UB78_OWEFU|nr:unnamed protein product [Owenia fusiformis]